VSTLEKVRETPLTSDAVILPFRKRGSVVNAAPVQKRGYVVKGRYERHRRKINIWAWDDNDAVDAATTLLSWHAYNSGPFTQLVWQKGEIQLFAVDDNRFISTITVRPHPLAIVTPTGN